MALHDNEKVFSHIPGVHANQKAEWKVMRRMAVILILIHWMTDQSVLFCKQHICNSSHFVQAVLIQFT